MKLTTGAIDGQQWDNPQNRNGFTGGGNWLFFTAHLFWRFSLVLHWARVYWAHRLDQGVQLIQLISSLVATPRPEMGVSGKGDMQNVQCWGGSRNVFGNHWARMAPWLSLGFGMKSLEPLSDPTLVQWVLGSSGCTQCGESMQAVLEDEGIDTIEWAPTLAWPKSNRTPLGHYVSVHLTPPGCTSDCPGAQWCSGPDLGENTPGHHPSPH